MPSRLAQCKRNAHGIWERNENGLWGCKQKERGLEEECVRTLRSKVSGRKMRKVVGLEGEGARRRERSKEQRAKRKRSR
jgi:hypothetical protein